MGLRKQKREPELQDIVRQRLYRDLSAVPQVLSLGAEPTGRTAALAVAEVPAEWDAGGAAEPESDFALSLAVDWIEEPGLGVAAATPMVADSMAAPEDTNWAANHALLEQWSTSGAVGASPRGGAPTRGTPPAETSAAQTRPVFEPITIAEWVSTEAPSFEPTPTFEPVMPVFSSAAPTFEPVVERAFEPVVERAFEPVVEPTVAPAEPVLEIRGLVPPGGSLDLTLDFEIQEGDLVIIEGEREAAARAWKAMAGIGDTLAGDVRVGGQSQNDLSYSDQAAYRVMAPGVLLEPAVFEPSFTVKENLVSTLLLTGQSPSECDAAATWALKQLGIEAIADAAPTHLDERERALAMLARAIIGDPYVLWIDAPVERFGPTGGRAVLDAAERLRLLEGCAVVMIGAHGEFADADARHLVATREGVRVRA